jgi:hypothetical protein
MAAVRGFGKMTTSTTKAMLVDVPLALTGGCIMLRRCMARMCRIMGLLMTGRVHHGRLEGEFETLSSLLIQIMAPLLITDVIL